MTYWREHWGKITMLIVAVGCVLPPAIFGEARTVEGQFGGDSWRNFLYDFQTLIGGLFAVFAAWWTVDMMRLTDQAAQRRHDQIIEATIFRDKRALSRAKNHIFERIAAVKSLCGYFTDKSVAELRAERPTVIRTRYSNAISFVRRLEKAFDDPEWAGAKDLLEPEIIALCVELKNVCIQFLLFSPPNQQRFAPNFSPTDEQLEWLSVYSLVVIQLADRLEEALGKWKVL